MVEQKGFAIQRPSPAAESESRAMFDWNGEMVELERAGWNLLLEELREAAAIGRAVAAA